jgi:hypothetical protein
MSVVDAVWLPAQHTFLAVEWNTPVAWSSNESWAKIKAREDIQETHFFNCLQEETFHNWKMQTITANPGLWRLYLINHCSQFPFHKQKAVDI